MITYDLDWVRLNDLLILNFWFVYLKSVNEVFRVMYVIIVCNEMRI